MRRPVPIFASWLLLVLVLLLWPALSLRAQPPGPGETHAHPAAPGAEAPAPPANHPDEKLPSSIREAYERAERFGEEPSKEPEEHEQHEHSLWYDGVHYVGVAGGLLLLAGLATGLWIYLVIAFRTGPHRVLIHRVWRRWHYALGFVAGGLALAHVLGRYVQVGGVGVEFGPPTLTSAAFILLVVSGLLRAWPPRALARHPHWWAWSHRVFAAAALLALFWHGLSEYLHFANSG